MADVTQGMLTAFGEHGIPYLEAFPDEIFQNNRTLSFLSKMGAYVKKKKMEMTNGRSDDMNLGSLFKPLDGRSVGVDYDISEFLTADQIQSGDFYIQDRTKIEHQEGGGMVRGRHFAADVGIGMSVPLKEMQLWDELYRGSKLGAMKLKWTEKWKGFLNRFAMFIANQFYYGLGTVDTDGTGLDLFNTAKIETSLGLTKPSLNQLEGIMYHLFDPTYDYGGVDVSKYGYFAPYSKDMSALSASASVFGYTSSASIDTRTELIGTTNSKTAGVPVILDIIGRMIRYMDAGKKEKVQLVVVSQDIYDCVVDAKTSKLYTPYGGGDGPFLERLMEAGIMNAQIVNGVPIIADDSAIESPTSKTGEYIFPIDTMLFYKKLDSFEFFANRLNNFKASPFAPMPGVWNTQETHVSGTILSMNNYRSGQGILKLPTVTYTS